MGKPQYKWMNDLITWSQSPKDDIMPYKTVIKYSSNKGIPPKEKEADYNISCSLPQVLFYSNMYALVIKQTEFNYWLSGIKW